MEQDGEKVVQDQLLSPQEKPVLFVKNMAHHFVALKPDFLKEMVNIFLVRDPKEMLPSLVQQIPQPIMRDTAYAKQVEIFDILYHWGQRPIVIDSRELLKSPACILRQLCDRVGIPFEANMLQWAKGPRPEDGVWAKYWYHNVHESTGFAPYTPQYKTVPDKLQSLLLSCQPLYAKLSAYALRCAEAVVE